MASAAAVSLAFVPERLGGGATRPYYNVATAAYLFTSKGKSLHLLRAIFLGTSLEADDAGNKTLLLDFTRQFGENKNSIDTVNK